MGKESDLPIEVHITRANPFLSVFHGKRVSDPCRGVRDMLISQDHFSLGIRYSTDSMAPYTGCLKGAAGN